MKKLKFKKYIIDGQLKCGKGLIYSPLQLTDVVLELIVTRFKKYYLRICHATDDYIFEIDHVLYFTLMNKYNT